jgi:predicted flavoprotein YhiN
MELKSVPGLYFAGEILNLRGLPDGDHMRLMLATAAVAGRSAAKAFTSIG